jgi:copper chaperone CopZ
MSTTTYAVSGMTCEHCVHAVRTELTELAGVQDVRIELVPGGQSSVTVDSAQPLTRDEVAAAVDEAGYELA